MKFLVSIAILLSTISAQAGAGASLWNGAHVNLKGRMLIQDADNPDTFYWLPTKFKLRTHSDLIPDENGNLVIKNTQAVTQGFIEDANGNKFSKYDMKVSLENLGQEKLIRATQKLRRIHGYEAKIVGMLPLCGMALGLPTIIGAADSSANITQVKFGFSQDSLDNCTNFNVARTFNISILVPKKLEPAFAKSMMKGIGPAFPSIKLAHPYKYEDNVSLKIDTRKFRSMMSAGGKLTGTFKYVSAQVEAKISKAMKQLAFTGHLKLNIQSTDPQIKAHYMKMFTEMLKNYFYSFTATKDGNTPNEQDPLKPVTFSSSNGGSGSSAIVGVELAYSKEEVEEIGVIDISINDINYGAIQSHNTIEIPALNKENFSQELQNLL
ncbi:hypothetical protein A9Q84_20225 [Halobacteriovorax marinus]|uniref:Secreted protein n=1 Tax=Halobacteriovorax marinus TaxID=97084 RepID=A0A1Y5F7H2_9BACT|nr:hypothetical protein A9Q84_20225 [Halobacteriovorax marinus]